MWDYCGGTDDGDVRHVDLVLLDAEVTHKFSVLLSIIVGLFCISCCLLTILLCVPGLF